MQLDNNVVPSLAGIDSLALHASDWELCALISLARQTGFLIDEILSMHAPYDARRQALSLALCYRLGTSFDASENLFAMEYNQSVYSVLLLVVTHY